MLAFPYELNALAFLDAIAAKALQVTALIYVDVRRINLRKCWQIQPAVTDFTQPPQSPHRASVLMLGPCSARRALYRSATRGMVTVVDPVPFPAALQAVPSPQELLQKGAATAEVPSLYECIKPMVWGSNGHSGCSACNLILHT